MHQKYLKSTIMLISGSLLPNLGNDDGFVSEIPPIVMNHLSTADLRILSLVYDAKSWAAVSFRISSEHVICLPEVPLHHVINFFLTDSQKMR